jgi:hypothetical protein
MMPPAPTVPVSIASGFLDTPKTMKDDSERTATTAETIVLSQAQQRVYSKEHLQLFDLLDSPMWIFDIINKSLWWANDAGCEVWEAPDVGSLCARDFATDMTKTSARAMKAWLERFEKGEKIPVTVSAAPFVANMMEFFTLHR